MAQAKTLSKAELKRVLDYNDAIERYAERNRTMLLLTHLCGMRICEVVHLRWGDVMNPDSTVRDEVRLRTEQTKGRKQRTVLLNTRIRKEIKCYAQHAKSALHTDFMFKTQKSQCFSANSATQLLQRIYARAGIGGATAHSGRRTFITELAAKGVSVRVIAELVGHRSIATTQRYIDIQPSMLRNAVDLL